MSFLINWIVAALAVAIVSYLLPGVTVTSAFAALVTALVLGLVNAFIRPVLILLTLPLTIVTLGLFALVINAFMVMLTAAVVPGFIVAGFWWALLFSLVLALINWALSSLAL